MQKTPRFKKKPEGEGRGRWSVDAIKFATARGAWLRGWRIPVSKSDSTVWGPLRAKSHVVVKRHPVGVVRKFGERSTSSSVVLVISTVVQNYEIRPKIAIVLLQNGMLMKLNKINSNCKCFSKIKCLKGLHQSITVCLEVHYKEEKSIKLLITKTK
ncbi:hypothetical protein AVEN_189477-1 [Araneus ventricosus]|uniref:Uncharacterized protein n=1 Tax=Araneus ventricosus TaxID=182803 RepID=A0A4Y2ML39_ARAVE|nr:hypothetical protein AVEN_189477-1 [Araneus ventricosus]